MSDTETTVLALRQRVAAFARERDWEQFYTPKDVAAGLTVEAASRGDRDVATARHAPHPMP